jgi:hypothetical protein
MRECVNAGPSRERLCHYALLRASCSVAHRKQEVIAQVRARLLVLTPIPKPNEPLRGVRRPKGRERAKDRKDDQGRNGRVVQIGPDGLAASAHVMGRPQDRAPHWGYRRSCLSDAVGCPDRGRERAAG